MLVLIMLVENIKKHHPLTCKMIYWIFIIATSAITSKIITDLYIK